MPRKKAVRAEGETGPVLLTDRRRDALRWVAECGMLTVDQLCRLGPYTPKAAYAYVEKLRDAGWIASSKVPVYFLRRDLGEDAPGLTYANTGLVLTPTTKGLLVLEREGILSFRPSVPGFRPHNPSGIAHEVAVREFRVLLEEKRRDLPGCEVRDWRSGRDAKAGKANPDASFVLASPAREQRFYLEVDRGTEWADKWEKKAGDYRAVLDAEPGAAVLVTVPDGRRAEWVAQTVYARQPEVVNRLVVAPFGAFRGAGLTDAAWTVPGTGKRTPLIPAKDFARDGAA
jgi:hypothetical protein